MFIKQYRHRLPIDHDMEKIRTRANAGGPLWESKPGLCFKVFAMQERGRHGAVSNSYSSLYLWSQMDAAIDFLWGDGFQNVFDTFGRPSVETWVPIDARKGNASNAAFLHREDVDVPIGLSLTDLRAEETARSLANVSKPDTVASVIGLNLTTWRLVRFTLSETLPSTNDRQVTYQVAYLAQPGLSQLN